MSYVNTGFWNNEATTLLLPPLGLQLLIFKAIVCFQWSFIVTCALQYYFDMQSITTYSLHPPPLQLKTCFSSHFPSTEEFLTPKSRFCFSPHCCSLAQWVCPAIPVFIRSILKYFRKYTLQKVPSAAPICNFSLNLWRISKHIWEDLLWPIHQNIFNIFK